VPAAALAVAATVTVDFDGKPATVQVLGERAGGTGDRYVKYTGSLVMPAGWIAVVSKQTADSLMPPESELISGP
jgi:hypothetical protein